jgi:pimeloyl-ACP methyl ester carboxylesterase
MIKETLVHFKNGRFRLSGVLALPSKKTKLAIIFVNSFQGTYQQEYYAITATREFCKKGFATLRFNPRDRWPGNGKMADTGLFDQIKDLEAAVGLMKKKGYEKIGLMGHSQGGLNIILANKKDINAIVLLEPSIVKGWATPAILESGFKKYYINEQYGVLMSKKFLGDFIKLKNATPYLKKIKCPVMFIVGDKNYLTKYVRSYYKNANNPKALKIIKGASHTFELYAHERKMLDYSVSWFKKWLKQS